MRIIVLILAFDHEPYAAMEREQRRTWAAPERLTAGRAVYSYYGVPGGPVHWVLRAVGRGLRNAGLDDARARILGLGGSVWAKRPVTQHGNRIQTGVPESYLNTNAKTWAAVRYILATYPFDYLLRINTSSYVNFSLLEELTDRLPATGYYGGFIGHDKGVPFASGAGMIMSRDVAELAFANPSWEFHLVDDVALGRMAARCGVGVQHLPRVEVVSAKDPVLAETQPFTSCFLVRCKSITDRAEDAEIMRLVHGVYQKLGMA
jgi:hypothetical protein